MATAGYGKQKTPKKSGVKAKGPKGAKASGKMSTSSSSLLAKSKKGMGRKK